MVDDVRVGVTMKGNVISEAILTGYKDIENRRVSLPPGWIALHTGKGKVDAQMDCELRHLCPDLPSAEDCIESAVVGLFYVEKSMKIQELKADAGCGCPPARHSAECSMSPFAIGPVCNLISASIRLQHPLPCKGQVGYWKLKDEVREAIMKQLHLASYQSFEGRPWAQRRVCKTGVLHSKPRLLWKTGVLHGEPSERAAPY